MKLKFIINCFLVFILIVQVNAQRPYTEAELNEILRGSKTVEIFDSIANALFFHSALFNVDGSIKLNYGKPDDYEPYYNDSIIKARIAKLNAKSPFEYRYTPEVKAHIEYYLRRREMVRRILGLTELYFPLFETMLDKYKLPLELKFLAIIESALNPIARSRAGACGLWQFMLTTGNMYNLYVDSYVDDRFDPYKSTEAACRHLVDLYKIYGDWALCLAAYNAGAGRVNRTINKNGKVADYWEIQPSLPRETQLYVPAFIAASYVFTYYKEHNIKPISPVILHTAIDTVAVKAELSFEVLSETLDIPIELLQVLNPAYKLNVIPAPYNENRPFYLRLPKNKIISFDNKELEMYFKTYLKKYPFLADYYTLDKVDSSIMDLQPSLISNNIVEISDSLNYEEQSSTEETALDEETDTNVIDTPRNLTQITSIKQLNEIINNISSFQYKPGQTKNGKLPPTTITHTVKKGETLNTIARKYNCSVDNIMKTNRLRSHSIHPGQQLLINTAITNSNPSVNKSTNNVVWHTVRRGETLWSIANKYSVSVNKIISDNKISGKNIVVGQKLKINLQ